MQTDIAAPILAELGHPTRLAIFRYLIKGGKSGIPVGEIQSALGVPGSTLSHHIGRLVAVELVRQHREGRTLFCIPQYTVLDELVGYLQEECCVNESCEID